MYMLLSMRSVQQLHLFPDVMANNKSSAGSISAANTTNVQARDILTKVARAAHSTTLVTKRGNSRTVAPQGNARAASEEAPCLALRACIVRVCMPCFGALGAREACILFAARQLSSAASDWRASNSLAMQALGKANSHRVHTLCI